VPNEHREQAVAHLLLGEPRRNDGRRRCTRPNRLSALRPDRGFQRFHTASARSRHQPSWPSPSHALLPCLVEPRKGPRTLVSPRRIVF